MNSYERVTCSKGCATALREDTRAGLIYGPYRVPLILAGGYAGWKFGSREEWAAYANECVYCCAPLPRGRAARMTRELCARTMPQGC